MWISIEHSVIENETRISWRKLEEEKDVDTETWGLGSPQRVRNVGKEGSGRLVETTEFKTETFEGLQRKQQVAW